MQPNLDVRRGADGSIDVDRRQALRRRRYELNRMFARLGRFVAGARRCASWFDRVWVEAAIQIRHRQMRAMPAATPGGSEPDRREINQAAAAMGEAAIAQPPSSARRNGRG
jgi:hypothetical protein